MITKLPESINTIEEAKTFLTELYKNGEEYHPEDNAKDCLENITDEEGDRLNKLMNEIYLLPGNDDMQNMAFDPCGFILELDPEYKKDY